MSKSDQSISVSENWRKHWEAWKDSELSQSEYGRRHQLKMHTFRYWVTKFNQMAKPKTPTVLVKIPFAARPVPEAGLELHIGTKYRLIIRSNFDAELLQTVLSTLENRS